MEELLFGGWVLGQNFKTELQLLDIVTIGIYGYDQNLTNWLLNQPSNSPLIPRPNLLYLENRKLSHMYVKFFQKGSHFLEKLENLQVLLINISF